MPISPESSTPNGLQRAKIRMMRSSGLIRTVYLFVMMQRANMSIIFFWPENS
jgi:hypothetical protein